jgi:DNA-binding NarL/FixJ family response regulator
MPSFGDIEDLLFPRRRSSGSSERHPVVIIDDDPSVREGLELHLSDRFELTLCASAREGVDAVNAETCAVVLDVSMPGEDGFWACTEIRRKVLEIPVIFYSAYQDLKDPYAIINNHSPFGYVVKGDDIQKLIDKLELAVKLQSMIVSNRKLVESLAKDITP